MSPAQSCWRIALLLCAGLASGLLGSEVGDLLARPQLTRAEKARLLASEVSVHIRALDSAQALALVRSPADPSSRALVAWVRSYMRELDRQEHLVYLGHLFNEAKAVEPETAKMLFNHAAILFPHDYVQVSLFEDLQRAGWAITEGEFRFMVGKHLYLHASQGPLRPQPAVRAPIPPTANVAVVDRLVADARSTPPWGWLHSQPWEQHLDLLSGIRDGNYAVLEPDLLAMLDDPAAPATSRSMAYYLLVWISARRAVAAAPAPGQADATADPTWQKAESFRFNAFVDRDYTSAIEHLRTTLRAMERRTDRASAIRDLRAQGWRILPEDEVALDVR